MAVKTKRFITSTKNCSCSMTGVWRACAYCTGMVVVFHSPKACSHVARRMDLSSYYFSLGEGYPTQSIPVPLVSSQLEEKHSIFGGGERLEDCLRYVFKAYKPECIMVANSCVAGVIGDDVPSICEEMEIELGIPVLTIDSFGFLDGEYYKGYYDTATLLLERFLKPCPKKKNTAILLGDSGGAKSDYGMYVSRILARFGVEVIGQFPGYCAFNDMPNLAKAEFLVPLGRPGNHDENLTKLAKLMARKLNINFVANKYPLGKAGSEAWLRAWGELLGKTDVAEQIVAEEQLILNNGVQKYIPVTRNKKVVFGMGRLLKYFHPKELLEMLRLLEVDLLGVVIIDAYTREEKQQIKEVFKQLTEVPVYEQTEAGAEAILNEAELVITTHELQLTNKKQIFVPMIPKVGVKGMLTFMDAIYKLLCSKICGGGIAYVRK